MRTLMACAALAAASAAGAHDGHGGHGEAPVHLHPFDLVGLALVIAGVAWWLWRRSQR
jgi:hypothetical protein